MKKLFYSLAGCLFLLTFAACSDEDGDIKMPPPSKGEESVEEIIKVLEEQVEEASDFVEMLKIVDVTDLEEDELTVFAVRNANPGTRASSAVLDSVSIKRHIAKGSYSKEQLTDGQKLESISGDTLYISKNANNVYVNGIQIEGEAIPAGNSYIYVVPEVLPTQDTPDVPSVQAYTTTIRVMDITGGVDNPVPMDSVMIQTMEGDSLGSSEFVPTGTDMIMGGEIVIHHTSSVLEFQIAKTGYSNLENGYLLSAEGFTMDDGNFYPYTDLNGDGVINSNDLYRYKSPAPDFIFGFSTSLSYKNWTLSTSLRANVGNYVYNGMAMNTGAWNTMSYNTSQLNNLHSSYLETGFQSRQHLSDYYVENGSFLKMDNLSLTYNFGRVCRWFGLSASLLVQNVFCITKYSGADPEVPSGMDASFYPRPRTYSLSLGFDF